jgi:hypothetical protein
MPELKGRRTPGNRLVLGFDGGCSACSGLAKRIEEQLAGKLEVLSLREPRVAEWRKKTLGENTPLVPTLLEVRESGVVRAWTGWRLGANLGRFLGPADTWRVMQALGEFGGASGGASEGARPERHRRTGRGQAVGGLTRGQFLKGVGGAAVAMSVLSSTGKLASPVMAQESTTSGSLKSAGDEAVGASISHPAEFVVEREQFTFDDTYGFTLWKPKSGSSRDAHEHGETTPAVRVARARRLRPKEIERKVRARIAEYPDLSMKREEVIVGGRSFKGVAVGPIPGSTPSTEVYVPVEDRVYQVNVYGEKLNAEGRELLKRVRFGRPARSIDSLELPDGKEPEMHRKGSDAEAVAEREREAKAERRSARESQEAALESSTVSAQGGEVQLNSGCWRAPSWFFVQTQHGSLANKDGYWAKKWHASWPGWTQIGNPNYWGQYTHGSLGYGRCDSPSYTNDMYAIDYPLDYGDVVFSPFKGGTVTFAGKNYTHKDYGIFVIIKADNGAYVSMSAHLSGLAGNIYRGAYVTDETVIGYAGDTGGPDIPVGPPHLHQAFYRYPRYHADGSPYGGAGLQVVYHRYVGTAAGDGGGVYEFVKRRKDTSSTKTQGEWISN